MMPSVSQLIQNMQKRPEHALWVATQQLIVRGLMALKFLVAARLLGPEQIGLVGIALLSLAVVEAMTDTGISQAVIQHKNRIDRNEAGAVWTLQFVRGIVLGITLALVATPVALFFKTAESANLILIAAFIPLLKNAANPGLFITQRERNFRKISIYESSAALFDFMISMTLIKLGYGAISILVGSIAAEALKMTISWFWLRIKITPNLHWKKISNLTSYGKWIWGSSMITLILNQLDKALVAKFLGTQEFGLYQVASRIAQLLISDGVTALGQFLFPTFSEKFRNSQEETKKYFKKIIMRVGTAIAILAITISIFSPEILSLALGKDWLSAAPILRILSIGMFFGACIAILVSYSRAVGKPHFVTQAVFVQLITLCISAPILIINLQSVGMALASCTAMLSTVVFLTVRISKMNN